MALTDPQRRALHLATNRGGATVAIARRDVPARQVHPAVADRVVAAGWATLSHDTMLITRAGRAALTAPIPEAPPVFLRHRDGLTHLRRCAAVEAGEVLDTATLSGYWTEISDRRLAAARDKRAEARRLAESARRTA